MQDYTESKTNRPEYNRLAIGFGAILIFSVITYFVFFNEQNEKKTSSVATIAIPAPPENSILQVADDQPIIADKPVQQTSASVESEQRLEDVEIIDGDMMVVDDQTSFKSSDLIDKEIITEDISEPKTVTSDYSIEIPEKVIQAMIEQEGDVEPLNQKQESISISIDERIFDLEQVPDSISGIKGSNWLRQQPTKSYVLQLISAKNITNIEELVSGQSAIQDQLSGYTNYTPSGKPRYLLLYGIYPDYQTATEAIDELPVKLKSVNPWPRKVSGVIKEIDNARARGFGVNY